MGAEDCTAIVRGEAFPGDNRGRPCTAMRAAAPAPGLREVCDMNWRTTSLVAAAFLLGALAAGAGSLGAWEPLARVIGLTEPPAPASANVLSEHEIEALDGM